jgi:hypothetical protein
MTQEAEVADPVRQMATRLLRCGLFLALPAQLAAVQSPPSRSPTSPAPGVVKPDGQRDFDFEIGTWKTHLRLLRAPLSGSADWVEYQGTTVVRQVWDGRANLVELDVSGRAGRLQGLSLRLYDPRSRQWSLNFANIKTGTLSPPSIGGFTGGRGEFLSRESLDGRPILVRFVISVITADSCRFEQAYSGDGGRTWEVNWIATDARVTGEPEKAPGAAPSW